MFLAQLPLVHLHHLRLELLSLLPPVLDVVGQCQVVYTRQARGMLLAEFRLTSLHHLLKELLALLAPPIKPVCVCQRISAINNFFVFIT